jgi:hypothetical protein
MLEFVMIVLLPITSTITVVYQDVHQLDILQEKEDVSNVPYSVKLATAKDNAQNVEKDSFFKKAFVSINANQDIFNSNKNALNAKSNNAMFVTKLSITVLNVMLVFMPRKLRELGSVLRTVVMDSSYQMEDAHLAL